MSEMTREMEISTARTPSPETLPGDIVFVEGALNEVGHAMGRYMDPTPIAGDLLDPESVATDEKIAEILSRVKDDSPNIDPTTEQGVAELTEDMNGRARAAIEQATIPEVKHKIEDFRKTKTRGVASSLTKGPSISRRNFVRTAALGGFALIVSACAPKIIGSVIIPGDGGGVSPTTTEVSPTPTTESTKTPEPTPTATPTEAPTPTEIPIKVGLPEKFEDIQVVNEEDLPTFMPKLLAAEKDYVAKNPNKFKYQIQSVAGRSDWELDKTLRDIDPYNVWQIGINNFDTETNQGLSINLSSITLLKLKDGNFMYLLGVPGRFHYGGSANTSLTADSYIFHLAYYPAAIERRNASLGGSTDYYQKRLSPEALFQEMKDTSNKYQNFSVYLFYDSSASSILATTQGWQASGALLEKNDKEFNFSKKFSDWVHNWVYKGVGPDENYLDKLQTSPLPVSAAFPL